MPLVPRGGQSPAMIVGRARPDGAASGPECFGPRRGAGGPSSRRQIGILIDPTGDGLAGVPVNGSVPFSGNGDGLAGVPVNGSVPFSGNGEALIGLSVVVVGVNVSVATVVWPFVAPGVGIVPFNSSASSGEIALVTVVPLIPLIPLIPSVIEVGTEMVWVVEVVPVAPVVVVDEVVVLVGVPFPVGPVTLKPIGTWRTLAALDGVPTPEITTPWGWVGAFIPTIELVRPAGSEAETPKGPKALDALTVPTVLDGLTVPTVLDGLTVPTVLVPVVPLPRPRTVAPPVAESITIGSLAMAARVVSWAWGMPAAR